MNPSAATRTPTGAGSDEVAIAATTQTGDQGPTIRPHRRHTFGPACPSPSPATPSTVCAGAMTAGHHHRRIHRLRKPTTSLSPAASSTWAAIRWARASTQPADRVRTPVDPSALVSGQHCRERAPTATRPSPRTAPTPTRCVRRICRQGVRRRRSSPIWFLPPHPAARILIRLGHHRRADASRHHRRRSGQAQDPVPPARLVTAGNAAGILRRAPPPAARVGGDRSNWACPSRCGWSLTPSPVSPPR